MTASCSEAQAPAALPPPPSPPPPPRFQERYADADPTEFPSHFTIVFTREYGMWKYHACRLEVNLFLNANEARLLCYPAERAPVAAARRALTAEEAARLRRLAERADLYRADHVGRDTTPMDGTFDTIRFRPVGGGRAVVLVTSGNRSFANDEGRRDLVGTLSSLLAELLPAAL